MLVTCIYQQNWIAWLDLDNLQCKVLYVYIWIKYQSSVCVIYSYFWKHSNNFIACTKKITQSKHFLNSRVTPLWFCFNDMMNGITLTPPPPAWYLFWQKKTTTRHSCCCYCCCWPISHFFCQMEDLFIIWTECLFIGNYYKAGDGA